MTGDASGAWGFCWYCGKRIAAAALACPHCGAETRHVDRLAAERSPKSFGTAVALCGIFGTVGLHHFYLGNHLHGLFDFGLFVASMACYIAGFAYDDPNLILLAVVLFGIDALHTVFVFYRLITGGQRDGKGLLVAWPGQAR